MPKPTGVCRVSFSLPFALLEEVDALAEVLNLSRSELIRRALLAYLEQEQPERPLDRAALIQAYRHGPRIAEEIRVADPNVLLDKGGDF